MRKNNTRTLAKAALIAAAYVALTWVSETLGLGFGAVQFRLSEVLTILPVFTPAAIPGLTLGCALANAASPLGPVDIAVGTLATLLQAVCTRQLRNLRIRQIPVLSLLMPCVFNALFIGAEIAFLSAENGAFATLFLSTALTVGLGELLVCFVLGLPLYNLIEKRPNLKRILTE